ncbi:MAG: hypothetical protein HXX16_18255 [Bacteroidales bacterium]|nr:hypothetical protein [Bacteroidales bacterium]
MLDLLLQLIGLLAVGVLISLTIEVICITIQTIKEELLKRKSELNGVIKAFVKQKQIINGRHVVTLDMLDKLGNSKGSVKMEGQTCSVNKGQAISLY